MRKILLENLIIEARKTKIAMIGIDTQKYKLTNEEKRWLVDKGLDLGTGRNRVLLLLYPQKLRSRDARLRMKKYQEIKKEALDRLKELDKINDDFFVNAEFDRPLQNREIYANFSDMMEEADYFVDIGVFKKHDSERLRKWFLSICGNYLIDRFSKIDWEARKRAAEKFQRSLAGHLGIKKERRQK